MQSTPYILYLFCDFYMPSHQKVGRSLLLYDVKLLPDLFQFAQPEAVAQTLQHRTRSFQLGAVARTARQDDAHASSMYDQLMLFGLVNGSRQLFVITIP